MKEKPTKTKDQERIEKDRILFEEIFKSLTIEESKATFSAKDGKTFVGLFQGYAKKYEVELPSIFKPSRSSPEMPSLVTVGLYLEQQKIGPKPKPNQLSLFSNLLADTKKEIEEEGIKVVGIDISTDEDQALFAIQKIFHQTNYKGNVEGRKIDDKGKGFKYIGLLPAIEFTPAQFLEAFEVKKYRTAQGKMVYDGRGRARAFKALISLGKKPVLFVYKRKYWTTNNKGKRIRGEDRIEVIAPLFRVARGWEALRSGENTMLDKGKSNDVTDEKLKVIAVEPSPILVQDIIGYSLLKPANFKEEIKLKYPQASKFVYRMADFFMTQAELKRRHRAKLVIEENDLTIAYALRMDTYIKNRMWLRIRQVLNKCYKILKELEYLLEYETIQGQTMELERLVLNPEKFARTREIEKEQEKDKEV